MVGVVAFAFGVPETILSNERIAQITAKKAKELEAPVFTQIDIKLEPGIEVFYTKEEPGKPLSTLRIARGAVRWAKERGIHFLLFVAAPPHFRRAKRDLICAIKEAKAEITLMACEEICCDYPYEEWFCSDSTQARTRSFAEWDRRERFLRFLPMFLYKLTKG